MSAYNSNIFFYTINPGQIEVHLLSLLCYYHLLSKKSLISFLFSIAFEVFIISLGPLYHMVNFFMFVRQKCMRDIKFRNSGTIMMNLIVCKK